MEKWTGVVAALVVFVMAPPLTKADGVVGNGTAASCTETALDKALTGGGTVTFNCGGSATIMVSGTKTITRDTAVNACPQGIPDGRTVDITLIIQAVGYALTQCPAP